MRSETGTVTSPAERERTVVSGIIVLLLLLWLGFAVHRSPRFPGNLPGTLLGIAGAVLMVFPSLLYVAAKQSGPMKHWISAHVPMRRLLAWHTYGGIMGSVLALLHTGHRFESTLGIVLTGAMLLSVLSGYVGRYFLGYVALERREKQELLTRSVTEYNEITSQLSGQSMSLATVLASRRRRMRLRPRIGAVADPSERESVALAHRATLLANSIADLEYAIKAHELLNRRFAVWLRVHIAASVAMYALLGLHVWASLYFGLRWLA